MSLSLVEGSAVPARRTRAELVRVVAWWAFWNWVDSDRPAAGPPRSLFRPDELGIVRSLEAGELMATAALLVDIVGDCMHERGMPHVHDVRRFAGSMRMQSEHWFAVRACLSRARPRSSPARRRLCSRRRRSRAPPAGDPEREPDLDDTRPGRRP